MVELKPCPFCGGKAEVVQVGSARQSTIYGCTDCHCQLETGEVFNIGVQWNTRADSLAIAAAVQAEREACAKIALNETPGVYDNTDESEGFARACHRIAELIRSRPAPAVDVLGVVRRFLSITDQPGHSIDDQRAAWNELRSLVDGAAANNEGGK